MPVTFKGVDAVKATMEQIDVDTVELGSPAHLANHELTVMNEELEIKVGDVGAGVARARGVQHHQLEGAAKLHVAGLDGLNERLPAQVRAVDAVADHRVAFELADDERRAGLFDQNLEQCRQRLLGVDEFGLVEESAVPGDVGDHDRPTIGSLRACLLVSIHRTEGAQDTDTA